MKHLLAFGCGYSARAIGRQLGASGWAVTGTRRSREAAGRLSEDGINGIVFPDPAGADAIKEAMRTATHLLVSTPPDELGDPVLPTLRQAAGVPEQVRWIGYLSTIGVYGDRDGAWVDEATLPSPDTDRSRRRLAAEEAWGQFAREAGATLQIFRLAGIYGPGRSPLDRVLSRSAQRIVKPGQVFNRIHVDDIAGAVLAGIAHPEAAGVFNVTDDLPAPPQDVLTFAAELLGVQPPPEIAFEDAALSPMARSFYSECKRVRNGRLAADLGYTLRYPTYREGLQALAAG